MSSMLARLVLLLSGRWGDLAAEIERVQWRFAPGGATLLALGALGGAVLGVLWYARTTEGLTTRMRVLLAGLRIVGIIALAAVACGGVCEVRLARTVKPELLVLVDDSPSMEMTPAATGQLSRLQACRRELSAGSLAARLDERFAVRTLTTSAALGREGALREAPQDLAEAVIRGASSSSDRPVRHMLVLSDGSRIALGRLSDAASGLAMPVSALAAGAATVEDLAILSAVVPDFAYHRDRVLVTASLRAFVPAGTEADSDRAKPVLRLFHVEGEREQEVASVEVELPPTGDVVPARIEFQATRPGLNRYLLRLDNPSPELTQVNNELGFGLDVRDEKLRVLFIEGGASWEYRFVKRALDADPAVAFFGLVRIPPDEWFYQGPAKREDGRAVLKDPKLGPPDNLDELGYFDVVILGDLERKLFEQSNRFELFDRYVRAHGGGLCTIGGLNVYGAGNFEDTPLARLLPLRVEVEKKKHLINRFVPRLTAQGIVHPAMQLEFDPPANAKAWASLPWVEGGNAVRRAQAGASLLMVHPKLSTPAGPRPICAAWRCGKGRVFSTVLDGTWHWSLARAEDGPDYHRRFWSLLVRWLGGDPRNRRGNTLVLDTPMCETYQPLRVWTMLRDKNGTLQDTAEVTFTVQPPVGKAFTATPSTDAALPGRFELEFIPRTAGIWEIVADCRLPGGGEIKPRLRCDVRPSRAEYLRAMPDPTALRQLAAATGGRFAMLDQAGSLQLPDLPAEATTFERVIEFWRLPGLLGVAIACLSLEWFFRKRRGLG